MAFHKLHNTSRVRRSSTAAEVKNEVKKINWYFEVNTLPLTKIMGY
ncbi:MAG: hypothetical protein AAF349_02755 [Cyanobacteria bacterium P01_A01_bin.68]